MTVTVRIPTALRAYANQEAKTQVEAKTVGDALHALVTKHPALQAHLYEDAARLRSFVNVYVGERSIKDLQGLDTPLDDGATVLIVPSVAGG